MSFNVLTGATGARFDEIKSIINDYAPDVIGFQEVQPMTMKALQATYGEKYGYVILERDKSSKEATPLFYDKTKYDLVDSGSGWLSDTPDKMSKYEESDYHRVYVYVVLQNKETGTKFVHVNTHIDYIGAATTKQVQVLLELTKKFSYLPMFYTADWNMYTSSPGYSLMTKAGYLDASTMTDNAHIGPTMVGGSAPIDFCFTSAMHTYVDRYEVVDDHQYSNTASDHYAIYTEIYVAPIK
jgi:endonuclease/exonuclease/phosphatase family metal-dependent hydrolase